MTQGLPFEVLMVIRDAGRTAPPPFLPEIQGADLPQAQV